MFPLFPRTGHRPMGLHVRFLRDLAKARETPYTKSGRTRPRSCSYLDRLHRDIWLTLAQLPSPDGLAGVVHVIRLRRFVPDRLAQYGSHRPGPERLSPEDYAAAP